MSAQNCCSSLLRGHRSAQNRCSSLLEGHRSAQNRCSSLLEGHKSASKVLLKPASRLQWRSKSLVQYHCSKSLFEDAGLCDALPCSPLLLLYLPPCMDMHGSHLVSDISDDHIRGAYQGGMSRGPTALPLGPTASPMEPMDALGG